MAEIQRPAAAGFEGIAAVGNVVKVGDRVVTDGQLRLTPGAEVTIVDPGAVSAPAPAPGAGGARRGAGQGGAGQGGGRRGGG